MCVQSILIKVGFRRYNLSWSFVATTGPGCIGTKPRIVLSKRLKKSQKMKATLKFLVQNFVILFTDRILPLSKQWLANFGDLGLSNWENKLKINNKHFEGSNGALDRDLKRATFSFVLVIYTLCLASGTASLEFACTVSSSSRLNHQNPSQRWIFPLGAVKVASKL